MISRMLVVSNTSPVSNLAIVDRLDLLRQRYGRVLIPPAVREELCALRHPEGKGRVEAAIRDGWLGVELLPAEARVFSLPEELDRGETEAIQLARCMGADKVLLDDTHARAVAQMLGLNFAGLLGELLFAKQSGAIISVRHEIHRLRSEARFFIGPKVAAVIVAAAGE